LGWYLPNIDFRGERDGDELSQITHNTYTQLDHISGVASTVASHQNIRMRITSWYTRNTTDFGARG